MKDIFYRIYNVANAQRFTEMSAKKLMHDFNIIDSDFDSGKNSRYLMKRGALFADYLKRGKDFYTDNNFNKFVDPIEFVKYCFKEAIKNNVDLNHFKDCLFYFILGMGNTFPIDKGYKKIPVINKTTGIYELKDISERQALEVMLEDYYIDAQKELTGNINEKEISLYLRNLRDFRAGKIVIGKNRISESHSQGICPVCGEEMWSSDSVAQIEKGKWVHEYHCTPESVERLEDYCEKYWDTHDNDKYFNPPMCELRK